MSYLVLARKYRPSRFSDLIGQEHIAQTLTNAFQLGKIHHAYLFTGTRGIGKTSAARIFAKALRCEHPEAQPGKKMYGVPCNKCTSCKEIDASSTMDVIEIDGASHNGVENIREIRDSVSYMPSRGQFKVYIIDEVHMLTTAAFNALLKTLEEPPAHIRFILATTEIQKIPATILSRCQRFDFKRVSPSKIEKALANICKKEKVEAEKNVLAMLARKADGSMRDALSLLDQSLALCGNSLTVNDVGQALSIVDRDLLLATIQGLFTDRIVESLANVQKMFDTGISMKNLAIDLAETVRTLSFAKLRVPVEGFDDESTEQLEKTVENISQEALQAAYRILIEAIEEVTRSPLPKASLEMSLIQVSHVSDLKSIGELWQQAQAIAKGSANVAQAAGNRAALLGRPTSTNISGSATTKPITPQVNSVPATNADSANTSANLKSSGPVNWDGFVRFATQKRPSLGALLEHCLLLTSISEWQQKSTIEFAFREEQSFYYEQCQTGQRKQQIESLLSEYLNAKKTVNIRKLGSEPLAKSSTAANNSLKVPTSSGGTSKSIAEKSAQQREKEIAQQKESALADPIVQATQEIFGARLVHVQQKEQSKKVRT